MSKVLWTGDGTLFPNEVELAQRANHGQSESQSAGVVGISTPCREISRGWIPIPACDPFVPG